MRTLIAFLMLSSPLMAAWNTASYTPASQASVTWETAPPIYEPGASRKPLPKKDTGYRLKRGDPNDRSIIDNGEALPQPGDQTIDQPEGETFSGVQAASCPCGIEGCSCPAGECDCTKVQSAGPLVNQSGDSVQGRILYLLTQPGCPPCPGAKANADKSGVLVQEVDIRANMAFAESLWAGCSSELSTPSWVLTEDGKPIKHWKGQSNPTGVREMLAFDATPLPGARPAGVALASQGAPVGLTQPAIEYKTVVRSDWHTHVCNRCGHSWSHHDSNHGSYAAHTCPRCRNLDWDVSSGSARVRVPVQTGGYVVSQPVRQYAARTIRYASGCPGGRCP